MYGRDTHRRSETAARGASLSLIAAHQQFAGAPGQIDASLVEDQVMAGPQPRSFMFLYAAVTARPTATIAGRVMDAETGATIPATITIRASAVASCACTEFGSSLNPGAWP